MLTMLQGKGRVGSTIFLRTDASGKDSLHMKMTNNNWVSAILMTLYWNQGKYAQAEALLQRVLAIREQHLGSNHPVLPSLLKIWRRENETTILT